ncbi:hypothetical protein RR45_GL000857 [Lactococcus chungangensis CAU 28 = DSM 22330]|uniref:Uncharacterized protein n=1 Tax=Pseudolactococcus chungangensis CAU 28 = DSM 22330 TaxID=1122154 RepID=A0ABX4IBQ5_9LACT|nr:hypothetical protein RR45_GL000857 [Lactococcus chungangensis CAU 28 = DSM 22330]
MGGVWLNRQEIHYTFFTDIISVTVVTDKGIMIKVKRCVT